MPNYTRAIKPGGTFFFTVVTYGRQGFLFEDTARPLLREAIIETGRRWPFEMVAFVLLPDHLHTIWTLPEGDTDFSRRWALIKKTFTKSWIAAGRVPRWVSAAKHHDRRAGVWQQRFWEHWIRDETDFQRHLDYVHYNPVKHGLVACPHEWPHSTFSRWVDKGVYGRDWQCGCGGTVVTPPKFEGMLVEDME